MYQFILMEFLVFYAVISGYKWVKYTGARYIVPGMILIGRDLDGSSLVVGRAYHHGDLIPAKAKPEHGVAYCSYGGAEHTKHDFEVRVTLFLFLILIQFRQSKNF